MLRARRQEATARGQRDRKGSPRETPTCTEKTPERAPRRSKNHLRIESVDFQHCGYCSHHVEVSEGRRVILEAQNRPQAAPITEKQQLRRTTNQKRRQEATKRGQIESKRSPAQWWSALVGQIGGPKRPPIDSQEHPKEVQKSPKTLSGPSSDRKRRFVIIQPLRAFRRTYLREEDGG